MAYPIVIIPVLVGCIVQLTKFMLSIIRHGKMEWKYLFGPGHMPSAHTAFVVSLVVVVARLDTIYSTNFAISFVFAYIVIYDALKIRTNIGYNGAVMNKLIKNIPGIKKEDYPPLKERVGHKPLEVLVGGIMGVILTVLLVFILNDL